MYNMDGSSPSGFTNSTFTGMNYTSNGTTPTPTPDPNNPSPSPTPGPQPTPPNTITDYSTVKITSLKDLFAKATDMYSFFALIWYNMWVLFVWF